MCSNRGLVVFRTIAAADADVVLFEDGTSGTQLTQE